MRLFVLFDMPVETAAQRREYSRFRKSLLKWGFIMVQYSVYARLCQNESDVDKNINRVLSFNPKFGNIRILKVTENQYDSMIIVHGEKSLQESKFVKIDSSLTYLY